MKNAFALVIIFLTSNAVHAQGFFNQKGAWIKNQIKQIALCQVYIKDLGKGYNIAKNGLEAIGSIKNGEFHLHLNHFNSLEAVNPVILPYANAAAILLLQADIKKLYVKTDDDYVNAVFTLLIEQGQEDIETLNTLLSPGKYAMTDDERIERIDQLYADIREKYAFAQSFSSEVKILLVQQLKEKNEVLSSRLINNIKLP